MWQWLWTPLSGATEHVLAPWAMWHGRVMVLAWGILLPLGSLLARFGKIRPGQNWPHELDSKLWWHGHLALQIGGVVLMSLGAYLAFGQGSQTHRFAPLHTTLGWALLVCAWLQGLAGWLRGSKGGPQDLTLRGDHYDMTPRRVLFERLHKSLGWGSVLASVLVIVLGLFLADAPRWMLITLTLWWGLLLGAFMFLQRGGYALDTYQAIWGPDPRHPGNQRPPIGLGVHRRPPR